MDKPWMSHPCFIHALSILYLYVIHIHSSSVDYPKILKEIVILSMEYPQNILELSNHLTLDNGWINRGYTCPTFVLTLSTSLEARGAS